MVHLLYLFDFLTYANEEALEKIVHLLIVGVKFEKVLVIAYYAIESA
jgi:hypothetical protein